MAPAGEEDVLYPCALCADTLLNPVTLPCCGESYCQECLRSWVIRRYEDADVVRCPSATCTRELSCRLPKISRALQETLEALAADDVRRRRQDMAEDEPARIPGEFHAWQEVAAARDLCIGSDTVVPFGVRGVVLMSHGEDRITVKFDERLIGTGALNVIPAEITPQVNPAHGFTIGQRIAAAKDLMIDEEVVCRFGDQGAVLRAFCMDRLTVQFDNREQALNVLVTEIFPYRLVGGFFMADRVQASRDLQSGLNMIVNSGTPGVVKGAYSDTRIIVQFDHRADGSSGGVNVLPTEITRIGAQ